VIYQKKQDMGTKVLDDDVVAKITPALEAVVTGGTGRMSRIDRPSAGKTGTTNEFRDAWFCGFVPQMTTIVWFGNDNNTPLRVKVNGRPVGAGIAGGAIPAPVWGLYMGKALKDVPVEDFKLVPGSGYSHYAASATGTKSVETAPKNENQSTENEQGKKALEPDFLDFQNEPAKTTDKKNKNGEAKPTQPETPPSNNGTTNYDNLF